MYFNIFSELLAKEALRYLLIQRQSFIVFLPPPDLELHYWKCLEAPESHRFHITQFPYIYHSVNLLDSPPAPQSLKLHCIKLDSLFFFIIFFIFECYFFLHIFVLILTRKLTLIKHLTAFSLSKLFKFPVEAIPPSLRI